MQQVTSLLDSYNKLQIYTIDETKIVITGSILVNRSSKGFQVYKEYLTQIVIPLNSDELPYVLDIGNHIDSNYPHRYYSGKICLETDTNIRIRFINGFSLKEWMSEYVELYYFSYEFFQRYGEFPFGERGHGWEGVIQTYSDLFNEPDCIKTLKLMSFISTNCYRGHILCPCGSGKKLRACHGSSIMRFYTDDRLKTIIKDDYLLLEEALKKYDEQQRYTKATK